MKGLFGLAIVNGQTGHEHTPESAHEAGLFRGQRTAEIMDSSAYLSPDQVIEHKVDAIGDCYREKVRFGHDEMDAQWCRGYVRGVLGWTS